MKLPHRSFAFVSHLLPVDVKMDDLKQFVVFNKKTIGRDKIYRVIQYTARLIIVHLKDSLTSDKRKNTLHRLQKLESSLGHGRKSKSLFVDSSPLSPQ